jgi:hypothetical protein
MELTRGLVQRHAFDEISVFSLLRTSEFFKIVIRSVIDGESKKGGGGGGIDSKIRFKPQSQQGVSFSFQFVPPRSSTVPSTQQQEQKEMVGFFKFGFRRWKVHLIKVGFVIGVNHFLISSSQLCFGETKKYSRRQDCSNLTVMI